MDDNVRAASMAKSLEFKDIRSFWKKITKTYNKSIPLATTVNGATDPQKISNVWKDHFNNLLNSVKSEVNMQYVNGLIDKIDSNDNIWYATLYTN